MRCTRRCGWCWKRGLKKRWERHTKCHLQLKEKLEGMGIYFLADRAHLLPSLNTVGIPAGADDAAVRKRLIEEYGIEIGAGLGAFKGKAWRIGLMGESATGAACGCGDIRSEDDSFLAGNMLARLPDGGYAATIADP